MQTIRLREATAEDHSAVEDALPFMSEALTRTQYVAALERMYELVRQWECLAELHCPVKWLPFVQARARRGLLEADLKVLGGTLPPRTEISLPVIETPAALLGGMYVMEGSRLGGQIIARHLDRVLSLQEGKGSSYFHGFGGKTGAMWKELTSLVESEITDGEAETAIRTAKEMFRAFGAWMQGDVKNPEQAGTTGADEVRHG